MKSGFRRHQIGIDYLWDAIFKMAAIEIGGIIFSPITQFLGWIETRCWCLTPCFFYVDEESNDNTEKSL